MDEKAFEQLEKRVTKLEEQRANDYDKLIDNNKELATIVIELKHITETMEKLSIDWKDGIKNNNAILDNRIKLLENNVNDLKTKFESKTNEIEDKVDERTIVKNSNLWEKATWLIISGFIGAIITYICTKMIG